MDTRESQQVLPLSATELAARIAQGAVSSVEVVEAYLARIQQVNPALNALVVERAEAARAEARAADARRARGEPLGPLHGVPFTLKESFALAGTPATYGLPARAHALASADDPYVARLRQAGAIPLGKTNVSQLLLYGESDNPVYGRTANPWDAARSPGGSSGGEAALVAAGGSPLGLGSDLGGSVRGPANACGVAGLMPTAGRLPDETFFGVPLGQRAVASQVSLLARGVADLALALEVLNGGRAPAVEPPRPLGDHTAVEVSALRVAYYTDDGTFTVAPAVRRAVVEAAGFLAGRGAQVTEWRPPEAAAALEIFYGVLGADGGRGARQFVGRDRKDPRVAELLRFAGAPRPLLAALRGALLVGGQRGAARMLGAFGRRDALHYWRLVEAQRDYARRFLHALETDDGGPFDVILCPAFALPAVPHGATRQLVTAGAYAPLYNVLGYPAGVVPVTRVRQGEESLRGRSRDAMERAARRTEVGSAGLPVGVQVVARPWREHVALAAMLAIESAAAATSEYPGAALPLTPRP